jgi:hypothetical protein
MSPRLFRQIQVNACRSALLGAGLLLCAAGARADIYDVTFFNVTFSALCNGSSLTCTEVINGSGLYNSATDTASNLSITMTGTLTAALDLYGAPVCTAPGCLKPNVLYDSGTVVGSNPIEFSPTLPTFDAPTPQALTGGPNGTILFVPGGCGGDNTATCGLPGSFPDGSAARYELASGTYTSVDVTPASVPEPSTLILLFISIVIIGLLRRTSRKVSA